MPDQEVKSEGKPSHRTKTAIAVDWGSKSLIALIPALATGYFAMKQAKYQADIEIARINGKANAGYDTFKDATKTLEKRLDDHERVIAELSKLLASERPSDGDDPTPAPVRVPRLRPGRVGGATVGGAGGLGAGRGAGASATPSAVKLESPEKLFKKHEKLDLPANLDEAAESLKE